ncbi:MAG TPA: nuclear transport factor 2 family protein [Opitutales bacterium]|nr:nuclear transport factor 2 family protein [Opitutales bacterium]
MSIKLPSIVKKYIAASNRHDVKSILACFSDTAAVRDEGETLLGKKAIESWLRKTIRKYKFQFKPLNAKQGTLKIVVSVEVSGTFDGSPITLDYHFTLESKKISSLSIE